MQVRKKRFVWPTVLGYSHYALSTVGESSYLGPNWTLPPRDAQRFASQVSLDPVRLAICINHCTLFPPPPVFLISSDLYK